MLRKPNQDVKPNILKPNQIWKRFSKEFNILLDIGYYEGTKFAQFFNAIDDGKSSIYSEDPYEEEIKEFDESPTNAMKFLVGLVGMGKTTLIRNYYHIMDREVKIRPANNCDEYLIYISFYYAELHTDNPHKSLTEEIERYMSAFIEKLLRSHVEIAHTETFWEGLYDFIIDNKPTLLSRNRFTPDGFNLSKISSNISSKEKKDRLEALFNSSPLEYDSSVIKYILKLLNKPYKITFIFDDIEAKASIFHKEAIEIARYIYSCFNANTDKNCTVKTLVSLRAYTFRVNMERIAEARRELIENHVILKKETVDLKSIFDKRFDAISALRIRNSDIDNIKSYTEAKKVLDYVEEKLDNNLIFALQNFNLCSSMVLYNKILTNLVWISYNDNEEDVERAFGLDEQNYELTKFNLLMAISMGNTMLYDGTSNCVPNIIQHNGTGSELLCLYIIRYLKNNKIDNVYGEKYIEGRELLVKILNLFCADMTPIRNHWENKIDNAISFLFQKGILFRSLYDVEIEDPDQIQRTYGDTFKLYLSPRGNKLYSLLEDNSVLLEVYRDDIEIDIPDNNIPTSSLFPFERFTYIIKLLHVLFTIEKQNIAQSLWNLEDYLENIGNEFIVQHLLHGIVNSIETYYGEKDENHHSIVRDLKELINDMISYGININQRYHAKFKLSGLYELKLKIDDDITQNLQNAFFTEDDLYNIASAEYSVQHQEMGYPSSWWDLLEETDIANIFEQLSNARQKELEQRMNKFVKKVDHDFAMLEEMMYDDFEDTLVFWKKRQAIIDNIIYKIKEKFSDFIAKEENSNMTQTYYANSESIEVQGTYEKVRKRYKEEDGYRIKELGGGNGNWLVTKPSDILVNGKSYREFVLDHYGRNRLTEKLAEQFRNDLDAGKVKLPD